VLGIQHRRHCSSGDAMFLIGLERVRLAGNISKDLQFCIGLGQAGGVFAENTSQAHQHKIDQPVMGFKVHLDFYVEAAVELFRPCYFFHFGVSLR